jgi:chromosome partitioning protein
MPRTIAVSSQKGGIGKTTMAGNLALAWGAAGRRVLVLDLDPQFALTRRFGIAPAEAPATVFDLLAGEGEVGDAVVPVRLGVDLLAARRELAKLELSLAGEHHRESFLADLLSTGACEYELVVIDCPPSLGLLTVNAIVAADDVLVPVNMTDEGALQGVVEVRAIVDQVARHIPVQIRALVRQMADHRRIVYQRMNTALRDLDLPTADTEIPLTALFHNAAPERVPVMAWRPDSLAADAYRRLARELDAMWQPISAVA